MEQIYNLNKIKDLADRCIQCKNPRCVEGCPANNRIPEFIKAIRENDLNKAMEINISKNPLNMICSRTCAIEKQCEGNCILGIKSEPVAISTIERYIGDYTLMHLPQIKELKGIKVAIIGSGPAGITVAMELAKEGFDVTIFEAKDKIGGVLRYGIPEFRLPKKIVDDIDDLLTMMGVKIRRNTLIGPVLTIDTLFKDGYKAIFIGTGVWQPKKLNIKGESLANSHFGIDYLKNPNVYRLGKKVIVIGAGNTAMDVARTAKDRGAEEVIVVYRRREEDMSARKVEINDSKKDGIKFKFLLSPMEIKEKGMVFQNMEVKGLGIDKVQIQPIKDSYMEIDCDSVIVAIGQGPRSVIVDSTKGIKTSERKGLVIVDELGHTTRDGVFACGDVVLGAATVVDAVNCSLKTAKAMEDFLTKINN